MNKIKNLFKASPIAVIVASLVIAGVASATIVSYISNAPTATTTVSAPVKMSIYEGNGVVDKTNDWYKTGGSSITPASTGGSSMPFTTVAENQANNTIGGYYVTVIEANDGLMTGKEFATMAFNKNKGNENVDITGALCVVRGDGTLTKLSAIPTWTNKKLILFYDSDGFGNVTPKCAKFNDKGELDSNGTERCEGGLCEALVPYIGTETRSFSHLAPKGNVPAVGESVETWTFTPKWVTGLLGTFTISAQYVNDLKTYAAEVYAAD